MGTELLIPLALAAVSGGAQYVNSQNVARKQDQTLAAQIRNQNQLQQQADAKTAQLIQKEGQSTDTQDKAKSQAQFNQALAQKMPQAAPALNVPGAVSAAYKNSKSDAALGISDYANNLSDVTSSIDAPTMERQRDQIQNIDPYQTSIGLLSRQNAGDNYLYNLKLNNIRANPWLSLISGVAGGAAGGLARGTGFGGSSTADAASGIPFAAPSVGSDVTMPWSPWGASSGMSGLTSGLPSRGYPGLGG